MIRPHPFDEIFAPLADTTFPAIKDQSSAVESVADFARTPATSTFLEQLAPPGEESPDPATIGATAHLGYLLYRFWQDGRATRSVARVDLDTADLSVAPTAPLVTAGLYLQFPERWFWARIAEDAPYEPLDGVFLAPTGDQVAMAAILGFRPERFGFSQLSALADRAALEAAPGIVREPPFGPAMEGGAEAGFRSIISEAELIHLAQLAHRWGAE